MKIHIIRMFLNGDNVKCDKVGRTGTDKKTGTDNESEWLIQIGSLPMPGCWDGQLKCWDGHWDGHILTQFV